jgi:hypothetical protein
METLRVDTGIGTHSFTVTSTVASQNITLTSQGDSNDQVELTSAGNATILTFESGNGTDSMHIAPGWRGTVNYRDPSNSSSQNIDTGADAVTMDASDAADDITNLGSLTSIGTTVLNSTRLESLRINGRGGSDQFHIQQQTQVFPIIIDAGDGDDFIEVFYTTAPVVILGGNGNDSLLAHSTSPWSGSFDGGPGGGGVQFYQIGGIINVDGDSFSASGNRSFSYTNVGAIIVDGGDLGDTINVTNTSVPMTVNGGNGDDTVNIGEGNLQAVSGLKNINGGFGVDTFNFYDQLNSNPDTYNISSNAFSRSGLRDTIFQQGEYLKLYTGDGDNSFVMPTLPTGSIQIYSGAGDDTFTLTPTSSTQNSALWVNAGPGTDTFNYSPFFSAYVFYSGGTGGDIFNVNGPYTLTDDASLTSEDLHFTIMPRGSLIMNSSQHLASLSIAAGGSAVLSAAGNRVLVTKNLDVQGTLDLADNSLIMQATAQTRAAALALVEGYLRSGYGAAPHWHGSGITSSAAAANASRALGVILNSTGGTNYDVFQGQTVDANSIIVGYTVVGDLNLDKSVSISDFIDLAANFNQSGGWQQGDLNFDGTVSISDFIDLAANFNQQLATLKIEPQPAASAASSLPTDDDDGILAASQDHARSSRKRNLQPLRHRHHRSWGQTRSHQRPLQRRV